MNEKNIDELQWHPSPVRNILAVESQNFNYRPEENTISGWMREQELWWLYQQAITMSSIIEIGSWKGRSTHALLSGCKGPVFSIDHFLGNATEGAREGNHKEATERDIFFDLVTNVGHFRNLHILRMDSLEAAKFFRPKSIDMIFIDAGHAYEEVVADILAWEPICKRLLCGHDYEDCRPDLIRAVHRMIPQIYVEWNTTIWFKYYDKEDKND